MKLGMLALVVAMMMGCGAAKTNECKFEAEMDDKYGTHMGHPLVWDCVCTEEEANERAVEARDFLIDYFQYQHELTRKQAKLLAVLVERKEAE